MQIIRTFLVVVAASCLVVERVQSAEPVAVDRKPVRGTYEPPVIKPEAILPGTIKQFTFAQSKIFPGTVRDVTVFIPAQYDGS